MAAFVGQDQGYAPIYQDLVRALVRILHPQTCRKDLYKDFVSTDRPSR